MKVFYWILALSIGQIHAHPLDVALIKFMPTEKQAVSVILEVNPAFGQAAPETPLLPGLLDRPATDKLLAISLSQTTVSRGGVACSWQIKNAEAQVVNEQTLRLSGELNCPQSGAMQLHFAFLKNLPTTFRLIVQIKGRDLEFLGGADAQNPGLTIELKQSHSLRDFVAMGVTHIGAAPQEWQGSTGFKLPEGIDHILFVIALLLASTLLKDVLKVITGFTIGHSITLALGAFNLIHFSSQWVEAAIAFSIAVVAAESLFLKSARQRWLVALLFGVIHGMGFSTALSELQLQGPNLLIALIGFNLGVEMGQLIIVAAVLPLLWCLRNRKLYQMGIKPALAAGIFCLGSYWFIARAFGG